MFWGISFSTHRLDTTHDQKEESFHSGCNQFYNSGWSTICRESRKSPDVIYSNYSPMVLTFVSSFFGIATYGKRVGGNQLCESIDVMLLKGNAFLLKVSHLCGLGST